MCRLHHFYQGIDSTSIVKNLSDSNFDVNTFSVIVKNKKYNEKYIDKVVNKYNTNHKEVLIDDSIPTNIVISAIRSLDEPSQILQLFQLIIVS